MMLSRITFMSCSLSREWLAPCDEGREGGEKEGHGWQGEGRGRGLGPRTRAWPSRTSKSA